VRPAAPPAAALVLWPLAVGSLTHLLVRSATGEARDLRILWRSARSLARGGPLYDAGTEFLYPPVSGWVLAPLGLLPFRAAVVVVSVASVAALVTSAVLLLRGAGVEVGTPSGSVVTAGTLLLLSTSRPVVGLLRLGNVDVLLLLVLTVAIGLLARRRDAAAAVLLAAAAAVKPVLLPALGALLLLGRVRALVTGTAVLLAVTLVGFATVPDAGSFTTRVVPLLVAGNRTELAPYDRSLQGAVEQLGLPGWPGTVLRVLVVLLTCWVCVRRRRAPAAAAEVLPLVLTAAVLTSSFAWADYGIYLLPLLTGVVRPGGLARSWLVWTGVYLATTTDAWHVGQLPPLPDTVLRLLPCWGWLLVVAGCALRARRVPDPAGGRR